MNGLREELPNSSDLLVFVKDNYHCYVVAFYKTLEIREKMYFQLFTGKQKKTTAEIY